MMNIDIYDFTFSFIKFKKQKHHILAIKVIGTKLHDSCLVFCKVFVYIATKKTQL